MVNTWVKNQLRDAWVDSGVHDGRIECSRSPEYAAAGIDMNVFRFSPVYTSGEADLLYFIGHDDIAAMGATNTEIFTTDATRTANQYFSLVMDCGGGVYSIDLIKAGSVAASE
ncbi:MAG: hypothetical protein HN816_10170 [Gammaproteobacteria bacterium]|nr:hypothetical protein [Gammaproteobacteria bacterium]